MNDGTETIADDQGYGKRLEAVRPRLVSFALLHLRDKARAEDTVQDALVTAMEKTDTFSGRSGYETWVFGILKHKILDAMRDQRSSGQWQPLDDEPRDDVIDRLFQRNGRWEPHARPSCWGDPEATLENESFWQVFDACMIGLPDNLARVFSLRELMGLSTRDICHETGIKENNCWVMLHRARLRLRTCIESGWLTENPQC
ncbi:sigma-70 family RNA polymerase sigma factor [Halomonas eurihalina]|uniref:Sigma-70 family RNA polymerase sigma factor n=1 Tax=Halomonas eurihalina TaxID=42566 RepID=A0A5D9D9F6_HALER|nr:sigma-70 family RNA polymerase sigma factor [Halomonas eurihalina]MDR5858881.1 sigma-70 family RNA polymerase sigma factor [Halomonas eurihalina]TZG39391.1 sigma-70 family RNA polymerase sigma factor [Halomonas eurihalina]